MREGTHAGDEPPVALDLQRNAPGEFAGKTITIHGCEYRVGATVRVGDQGSLHILTNRRSGLTLHLVQIRREYRDHPAAALSASRHKQALTAELRNARRIDGSDDAVVGVVSVIEAHGGSFELHEIPWGAVDDTGPSAVRDAVRDAFEAEERGDAPRAVALLEGALTGFPDHTAALLNLAGLLSRQGNAMRAHALAQRTLDIEPNCVAYRVAAIEIAMAFGSRTAYEVYRRLVARFPHVNDRDALGVELALRVGDIAGASERLPAVPLPPAARDGLVRQVETAQRCRRLFADLHESVRREGPNALGDDGVLTVLEALHAECPRDPEIRANLGFRLRARGEWRRAHALVLGALDGIAPAFAPHCLANAAYCLLELQEWDAACGLLDAAISTLVAGGRVLSPDDIPGLVDWIDTAGVVIEPARPTASEVLDGALRKCADASTLPPALARMADTLRALASAQRPAGPASGPE